MNRIYRLQNADESYKSNSYEKIFQLKVPEKIKLRNDYHYIAQRELNLESTYGWTYNLSDGYSWIRSWIFLKILFLIR